MTGPRLDALEPVVAAPTPAVIAGQLRARIVDGTFAPGTRMAEAQLSQRLGVSRGPVREALQRLIQEGLLVNVRNRGVFVLQPGPDDVADIYTARAAIERHAAAAVLADADPTALAALDSIVDEMAAVAGQGAWQSLAELDLAFHETLVAAAGSPRLVRMFRTLTAETRICLAALVDAYPDRGALAEEHRQLADLLRRGPRRQLLAAVDAHLASAVRDLTARGSAGPPRR